MAGAIPGPSSRYLRDAILITLIVLFGSVRFSFSATAPASAEISLKKSEGQWAVEGRFFRLSPQETISLYGIRRRRFLTDHWYWGEAGAGALTGTRGGYFEGGGTVGYQRILFRRVLAETHLFSGAGGGGGVQEGDGWMVRPTVGLGVAWRRGFTTTVEAGYSRFMSGTIRGWTAGLALNYSFWDLQ